MIRLVYAVYHILTFFAEVGLVCETILFLVFIALVQWRSNMKMAEVTVIDALYLKRLALSTFSMTGPSLES